MATPQQIAEQVALERDCIRQGLKRLRKNVKDLEKKSYASATVYGITSIDSLLPVLVERIQDTTKRIKEGHTGRSFKEIQRYLSDLEPLAAAAIACKITFDKVFSVKKDSDLAVNVCESIGRSVEDECQMRYYEEKAPGLLNVLKKQYWHKSIGTQQKITVIQTLMNRNNVTPWTSWGRANRVKLGAWLLDCIMETSGWFDKDTRREGRKTVNYIVPTDEFLKIKEQVMSDSELFAPIAYPMLIEPNDWTNERAGGYLLNEVMRGHDMVRRGEKGRIQGETPIAFLNKIQKVGYTVNTFVIDVADYLEYKGRSVGKFIPIVELDVPPKPPDIADNKESRKAYRRAAAEVKNINASAVKRSVRTRLTMEAARRFKGKTFFIPWSFDYRGRTYPIPAFLTPQDTDFGKSLIKFDKSSTVTPEAEEWLAFQVATTFGLDKSTMDERQQWVKDNIALITLIAENPCDNVHEWEEVEEPWQFLAACDEYYHCVIKKDCHSTSLPIATDATCSGLQILAGLALDRSTAELVNVLPSDRPQDAYKVVAEISKPNIPERLRPYWDRKAVKRSVMTIPYNAKPYSNRSYIKDALREKGIELDKDELTQTVKAVRDAMNQVVPGPMKVMQWIESEISNKIRTGDTEMIPYTVKDKEGNKVDKERLAYVNTIIRWLTTSDFEVNQRIMKKHYQRLQLQLLGKCEIRVATGDTKEVDYDRHLAATAPNLIHSLDATLLHLAAERFKHPIALIHDSVLCRATDMTTLSNIVRETYMHIFTDNKYLEVFAEKIKAETKPPIIGDFEPSTVLKSTYFFC